MAATIPTIKKIMVDFFDRQKKIKITIIDDEIGLVETVREFLESRGFQVNYAYAGKVGLDIIRNTLPDLVILDLSIPDMDGRDILSKLKKNINTKNLPVIILTGKTGGFDKELAIELGADSYVTKPYDGYFLLREINYIINKKKKENEKKDKRGGYKI